MSRTYQCVDWNPSSQTCDAAAWVEQSSIPEWLPTVEQAHTVGSALFVSLAILAAMSLLFPSRSNSDE